MVVEVEAEHGTIPDAKSRAAVHKEIAKLHHENLLIFVDRQRTQSLWYWVKRQDGKLFARDHLFFKGQPGDLFLGKLAQIVFDLADFDAEGNVGIVEVARRLQSALDVEKVTKKFFREFQEQHVNFLELIRGIRDERQRRWYASVLLNRLMFIYFLQKKPPGFLDGGNQNYLRDKLDESKKRGKDRYYPEFLHALFFEGFAKPEEKRSPAARALIGQVKYLNGGLFLPHQIEQQNDKIAVPDRAFENLFDLFDRYTWHLDDTPGGKDDEINPDVLGYIFEKYINQKAFGAYYTRTEITEYLCRAHDPSADSGRDKLPSLPSPSGRGAGGEGGQLDSEFRPCAGGEGGKGSPLRNPGRSPLGPRRRRLQAPALRSAAVAEPARSGLRLRRVSRGGNEDAHQHLLRHRRAGQVRR